MKVTLTFNERLNLRAVVAAHRGWGHIEVRRVYTLMDRLDLADEEKAAIHYVEAESGAATWDNKPENPPEPLDFDLNERDVRRIETALRSFQHAGGDRKWMEPLLDKFLPEGEE